jgi:outer membrane protein assembly factor BamB
MNQRWRSAWVRIFWVSGLAVGVMVAASAADWPTWRADVARSGVSAETLPAALELLWEWELPAVESAFPFESRLQFDTCYEVVSAGGRVVFGSSADGSVRCLDAATGAELWRFFTGGPVRAAPVLWEGRVIVGSDDGWLYCLKLADGTPAWTRRLAPEARPDLRHLGSNRLISPWPIRGGPVLADGVVYAGSGVWPTLGVFIWALEAATGKVLWCNDRVNWIADVRIDHNMTRDMGLTPCGYLAVSGDRLVVPNGRSHPAGLQRADGQLIYYVQGYRNGHCRVALSGLYGFVGKTGVISLQDFRELASRWAEAGQKGPEGYDGARIDFFEGPFLDYKSLPACDAFSVFDGARVYGLLNGVFSAYDLARAALSEQTVEKPTGAQHPYRWDVPVAWRQSTPLAGQAGRTLIKAGSRLYGCAGTTLMALDLVEPGARPGPISWQVDLGQPAESLAAAEGRLFVSTRQGRVVCYGAATAGSPRRWSEPAPGLPAAASWRGEALRLAQVADVSAGWAVLRSGGAEAVLGLLQGTSLSALAVVADAATADGLRRQLSGYGLLGPRATVIAASAILPPYLASLTLVAEADLPPDLASLWSTVHPYGGVVAISTADPGPVAERLRRAALPQATVSPGERLVLLRREGPLPGSAAWTHESADAARTYSSRDQLVQSPLGVLWYGEGPGYGFFKIHDYGLGHKPEVANGRVIALQQSTGTLFAYDAYTGRGFWQVKVAERPNPSPWLLDGSYEWSWTADGGPTPRYACEGESVYVAYEGACRVLDAASGKETARWDFADLGRAGAKPAVKGISVSPEQVVILAGYSAEQAIEQGLWDGELLLGFDRRTGQRLWVRQAVERFNSKAVAILNGSVYCVDSISPLDTDRWRRRGATLTEAESVVYALEAKSGVELWKKSCRYPYKVYGGSAWTAIMARDDWIAAAPEAGLILCGREGQVRALRPADGEELWKRDGGGLQPLIVGRERFLAQDGQAYSLKDGAALSQAALFARGGCNYGVGGEYLAFVRDYSAMWVDLGSGQRHYARNLRAGCSASLVAADGLLNAPNFSPGCMCNYPIQTCTAWVHMPGIESWAGAEAVKMTVPRGDNGVPKVSAAAGAKLREYASPHLLASLERAQSARLGEWRFDVGKALEEVVADSSPKSVPTRVVGSVALAPGVAGQCLVLVGQGRLSATLPADSRPRSAVSLCAWIRPEARLPYGPGMAGIVECAQIYRLCLVNAEAPYSAHFGVQLANGVWVSANTEKKIPAGQWTHLAGTFDGETGEVRIFLNGVEVARGTGTPGVFLREPQGPVQIGVRDTGSFFSGALDEVRVYQGTLSAAVVRTLANAATPPPAPAPPP